MNLGPAVARKSRGNLSRKDLVVLFYDPPACSPFRVSLLLGQGTVDDHVADLDVRRSKRRLPLSMLGLQMHCVHDDVSSGFENAGTIDPHPMKDTRLVTWDFSIGTKSLSD